MSVQVSCLSFLKGFLFFYLHYLYLIASVEESDQWSIDVGLVALIAPSFVSQILLSLFFFFFLSSHPIHDSAMWEKSSVMAAGGSCWTVQMARQQKSNADHTIAGVRRGWCSRALRGSVQSFSQCRLTCLNIVWNSVHIVWLAWTLRFFSIDLLAFWHDVLDTVQS